MFKLYEVVIQPRSLFGTPLAGDTLFGHLCWQFACDGSLLQKDFQDVIREYCGKPFLVVSSALPRIEREGERGYALPRPDLSLFGRVDLSDVSARKTMLETRKEMKKRKWLFAGERLQVCFDRESLLTADEVTDAALAACTEKERVHAGRSAAKGMVATWERTQNSINRLTQTTGAGFDPYRSDMISFIPGMTLSVFLLADEEVCAADSLQTACERIGMFGYGRDASSGLGRFEVKDMFERDIPNIGDANGCYTLAPAVPEQQTVQRGWFQPLTRFGKHGGGAELTGKPFKNPVLMAAEGAVFQVDPDIMVKPYLGCGITGVSKAIQETVVQGYTLYLPCRVEG